MATGTTQRVSRKLRPGEELLHSHGWTGAGRTAQFSVVPAAALMAISVSQLGLGHALTAAATGLLLAALILAWMNATYWVAVGPGYARVNNGVRNREFRPGPDLEAVRVASTGAVINPSGGILYLRQGRRRATVMLSADEHQRLLDVLRLQPYDVLGPLFGNVGTLPPQQRAVLPFVQRRPVVTALLGSAVIIVAAVFVVFWWVDRANTEYRAEAAPRLRAVAAAWLVGQPGWEPRGPERFEWAGSTDYEPLSWERPFRVPFEDEQSFLAWWTEVVGGGPGSADCDRDTFDPAIVLYCHAVTSRTFEGKPYLVTAELFVSTDRPNKLVVTLSDERD